MNVIFEYAVVLKLKTTKIYINTLMKFLNKDKITKLIN